MKKQGSIYQIAERIAVSLQAIASPQRIAILLSIGSGEARVWHLEAALGWRQAYISQHLMALRKADILQDRREGRYVFYRPTNPSLLDLVRAAAIYSGFSAESISALLSIQDNPACKCPQCVPALILTTSL
jgi:DNA-binding transcriptional ArsR family regulator